MQQIGQNAYLSQKLALIVTDLDIDVDLEEARPERFKPSEVQQLFRQLEFRTLMKRLATVMDWRKALGVYEQLRSLSPADESARRNLVQLNLRLSEETKANAELDDYLDHLKSQSEDDVAENFLQRLTEENPKYVMAHRRLAEHYQDKGERDKAIAEWNKAGEVLVDGGDEEGAKVAVRAILSLNPPNPEPYQKFLQKLSN